MWGAGAGSGARYSNASCGYLGGVGKLKDLRSSTHNRELSPIQATAAAKATIDERVSSMSLAARCSHRPQRGATGGDRVDVGAAMLMAYCCCGLLAGVRLAAAAAAPTPKRPLIELLVVTKAFEGGTSVRARVGDYVLIRVGDETLASRPNAAPLTYYSLENRAGELIVFTSQEAKFCRQIDERISLVPQPGGWVGG